MFITKYALACGIEERHDLRVDGEYAYLGNFEMFRIGRDAFESLHEAQEAADVMRKKKIASLEKQIKRLKELTFQDTT